jgi:hypothetical protein
VAHFAPWQVRGQRPPPGLHLRGGLGFAQRRGGEWRLNARHLGQFREHLNFVEQRALTRRLRESLAARAITLRLRQRSASSSNPMRRSRAARVSLSAAFSASSSAARSTTSAGGVLVIEVRTTEPDMRKVSHIGWRASRGNACI